MNAPLDFKRLLVIGNRACVLALVVVNEPQIVQNAPFQFPIFDFAGDLQAPIVVIDGFGIISPVPENQAQIAQRFANFQAAPQLLLDSEGALKVIESTVVVAQVLVGIADGIERQRLAEASVFLAEKSQGAIEFRERRARIALGGYLARASQDVISSW